MHFVFRRIKRFEITVSDIYVLRIPVSLFAAEIFRRRIVFFRKGNRIGQFAAWIDSSGQNICCRMPAFHAALPGIENRLRLIGLHPVHIDDASHIQRHDHPIKCRAHLFQHLLFPFRKIIAAPFAFGISVFARGSSDNDKRGIAFRRYLTDKGGI